jgi:hypothetical protein
LRGFRGQLGLAVVSHATLSSSTSTVHVKIQSVVLSVVKTKTVNNKYYPCLKKQQNYIV